MWTLLAMLALVITGGFISYYGDLQGRRWGKKRVSWFGMRPKHTAILITSLTGAAIALGTVIAVMIVAPDVRAVVLRGEAAINENRRIREETNRQIQIKQKLIASLSATFEETERGLKKGIAQEQADNARLKGANYDLEKTNNSLSEGNIDLQRQQAALKRSIDANRRQLAVQKKEIANAAIINSDLARQNTEYSRQNSDLAKSNTELRSTNSSLRQTNLKLKADSDRLASDYTMVKKTFDTATGLYTQKLDEYSELQGKMKDKQEEYESLTGRYASMKAQVDELTQQRDELSNLLAGTSRNFVREYIALRQTRYTLRADTELARRTLDAHLSPAAAREEVLALLKDASNRAKRYGAASGDNGRAVVIVSKRVVTPASIQMADENASINALVDAVAGSNTPVAVVARAINNSAANEQVIVELTPYASSMVFPQGAVVATRTIDARLPMDKLVESVILFLRQDVRTAAIKSGTIPQISPDTGEQEVGTIDTPEMVTLIDRIRRTGGNVQIIAVANESLTSADLLTFGQSRGGVKPHNLRFDLKRLPVTPPSPVTPASG